MSWSEMSSVVKVLALAARINPAVFDVFPPQHMGMAHRVDRVALNPQPLPPRDPLAAGGVETVMLNPQPLPPSDPLVTGGVMMAHRLVELAVEADVRDEQPARWLHQIVEEWCGTPWPRKWPWPGPGPHPAEGPQPEPWAVDEARVAGAAVFASMAARLGDGELRDALAQSAEMLAEAAANQPGASRDLAG